MLEVGCDVGTATNAIAEHFPNSNIVGIDINDHDQLKKAIADATLKNLKNVSYETQDVYKLPSDWSGRFDHVFAIDTIHGLRPHDSLKAIAQVLKPDGTLNLIELKGNAKMVDNKSLVNAPYLYVSGLVMAMQEGGHDHGHDEHDHGHDHGHDQHKHGHGHDHDDHDHEAKKAKYECVHTSQAGQDSGQDSEISHCGEGPGWWWGKTAIVKAVKEAGFKKVEEHKIPGSYSHVVYVCRK